MTDEPDLESLALAARDGDAAAMEQLLARIQPQVMRLCSRMLPHQQDAEEACQDALLRVATKLDSFRGGSRFSTWLHVVAGNSARMTYRTLKRRAAERPVDELPTYADPRTTSVIAGSRLDLLEALETLERESPDLVQPVVLRDIGQLDYQQIATQLELPLGTVKSRIHKARMRLRPLLVTRG
jgi:RNA polymerase sigma-70 factor (ECF subfamily)